jgi:hypothetical protein
MTTLSRRQMLGTLAGASLAFPFITRAASPKAKIANTRVISLWPNHYQLTGRLMSFCVDFWVNA